MSLNSSKDNSDAVPVVTTQDQYLATRTGELSEVEHMTKYIKYLKELASLEEEETKAMTINVGGKALPIGSLVPAMSDHEKQKLQIIALINNLGVDHPMVQKLQRDFGTNSTYQLADDYASYIISRESADKIYNIINGSVDGTDSIYDGLIGLDDKDGAKKKKAIDALASGKYGQYLARGRENK